MSHDTAFSIGIDVSGAKLHVARSDRKAVREFAYDDEGLERLLDFVAELASERIVLEATGGLERRLVDALQDRALPVAVVNPARVRSFAKSCGLLAKTDEVDARAIALYAARVQPALDAPVPPIRRRLQDLTARREQLVAQRVRETNRLKRAADPDARASLERALAFVQSEIEAIERLRQSLVQEDEESQRRSRRLRTIDAFGPATSAMLVSRLPELGTVSGKKIASLVGVAPVNCDSGTMRGKRIVKGGRADVRRALYTPTLVATKHNSRIRPFYERLRAAGKPHKVAMIACMHKLLAIANAVLRDDRDFVPVA
jgi:transposase